MKPVRESRSTERGDCLPLAVVRFQRMHRAAKCRLSTPRAPMAVVRFQRMHRAAKCRLSTPRAPMYAE